MLLHQTFWWKLIPVYRFIKHGTATHSSRIYLKSIRPNFCAPIKRFSYQENLHNSAIPTLNFQYIPPRLNMHRYALWLTFGLIKNEIFDSFYFYLFWQSCSPINEHFIWIKPKLLLHFYLWFESCLCNSVQIQICKPLQMHNHIFSSNSV